MSTIHTATILKLAIALEDYAKTQSGTLCQREIHGVIMGIKHMPRDRMQYRINGKVTAFERFMDALELAFRDAPAPVVPARKVIGGGAQGGLWMLVDKDTDAPVFEGETRTGFRGEYLIEHGFPPRHAASTGHVQTSTGYYNASVVNARWVRVTAAQLAGAL